ncbi:CMP deaminase [Roseicella sp. DB1501]|uniref:CMP deaminase n=1 Tax=Roseicella sp. DB1501 TaxID=2730925 RepID=UPI00149280FF|nr:CMP deaminase [Roseicella sp. DB1501]NOG73466.1 CMP deaminase [Roseicella sp. DB1501]
MTKKYSNSDLMKFAVKEQLKCTEYPKVGVVVAKYGLILSTGFRGEVAKKHAERVALEKLAMTDRIGSTVFTTLEPCVALQANQATESCADLIIASGVREVFVGVLDPNGTIYSQGFRKLLENNISVKFFNRKLRDAVEQETFEYGEIEKVIGPGKRRVPVVGSGIGIKVQFSETDQRTIDISWQTLQPAHGCVDLSSSNGAVRIAAGASRFSDITAPTVFRFPSHFARMKKDMIAIVLPEGSTFCVLIKLIDLFENDILLQWEVWNVQ